MHRLTSSREPRRRGHSLLESKAAMGVGVYDGLTARLCSEAGFQFLWLSSFCVSASCGLPDAGLLEPSQILERLRVIERTSTLPIVVDLETGYGDEIRLYHTAELMAEAEAAVVVIEDYSVSKRSSLYGPCDRTLCTIEEQRRRIKACTLAIEEAQSSMQIVARTEALVAGKPLEEALERAEAYNSAGADGIFLQSKDRTGREVLTFLNQWRRRSPVFLAPTLFPQVANADLFQAGASHIIYANQILRAAHRAMRETIEVLRAAVSAGVTEGIVSTVAEVGKTVNESGLFELENEIRAICINSEQLEVKA